MGVKAELSGRNDIWLTAKISGNAQYVSGARMVTTTLFEPPISAAWERR